MLRVDSSSILVVPPFECAWLLDEARQLKDNACCVAFEAKGDNDVTLILKPKPGSKRWQHMELQDAQAGMRVDQNYTIIFGSHRNSCLRIEKDAQECYRAERGACISSTNFVTCWVDFNDGKIDMGFGEPGSQPCYSWTDANPIAGIQHVGLGSWDKHVCFRNIRVLPPLSHTPASSTPPAAETRSNVLPLVALCQKAVVAAAGPDSVCEALPLVELLAPQMDSVAAGLICLLVRHLGETVASDPEGFQGLPPPLLAELLGHPNLECPERLVFEALMLWAFGSSAPAESVKPQQCVEDIEALLLLIRFPLMPPADLQELKLHPLAQWSPTFLQLLGEAEQNRMLGAVAHQPRKRIAVEGRRLVKEGQPPRPQLPLRFPRRHAPPSQHLMFVSPGDGNGVTHWLGTCYGSQEWMNPVLVGMMQVHASSPSCKHTDPKALVGRSFLRLNQAGPGRGGTWWLADLGPEHRLVCNYYTLRQDASFDFPRDWYLQASIDGVGWVELRRHEGDSSICMPQQCCAWPVTGHAASLPYRMFRLLLRGPNTSASGNRATFHLSQLELYGHFYRIK